MEKNVIIHGDSVDVLNNLPQGSIDLVVTDPPYLVNYIDRNGRSLKNDNNPDGVLPVFEPLVRAMKDHSYMICFCGWSALPIFAAEWERLGLRIVSQIVWKKNYTSRSGYTQYQHETAYVLAKGNPAKPQHPIASVQDWTYSGNKRHPTEKALDVIAPLIRSFSNPSDLVCDPFSGSGSTSVAALLNGRDYLGIDIDEQHVISARARLAGAQEYLARLSSQLTSSVA